MNDILSLKVNNFLIFDENDYSSAINYPSSRSLHSIIQNFIVVSSQTHYISLLALTNENEEFRKRRKLKQVVRHRHLSSPKIQRPLDSRLGGESRESQRKFPSPPPFLESVRRRDT